MQEMQVSHLMDIQSQVEKPASGFLSIRSLKVFPMLLFVAMETDSRSVAMVTEFRLPATHSLESLQNSGLLSV